MIQFADRVNRISPSPTLAALMAAQEYRARGIDVVDFGPGEPDFPTPEHIKRAAVEALEQNFTKYTAASGYLQLRESICRWHSEQFGSSYNAAECIFTSGGKHALFNAVNALIQTGDDVLMHVPYWVSFPDLITYAGGRPVQVQTRVEDGFQLRAEEVEKAITPRTKMLILNSPGNPTGAVVPPDEYQRIYEVCVRHNIWLLADECYSHFVYGDAKPYSIGSKAGSKEHIIIAGSLSKTFAMTGWRAGYALAPKAVIEAMVRLQSQSTSNACSITQKAAHAAMIGPMDDVAEMLSEYEKRRKHILAGLRGIPGIKCTAPQGAFYVFPDVSHFAGARGFAADTSTMAKEIIERAHVAVVAGEGFGAPGYLRLSYATSMERIDEGVRRLARYFTAAASAS